MVGSSKYVVTLPGLLIAFNGAKIILQPAALACVILIRIVVIFSRFPTKKTASLLLYTGNVLHSCGFLSSGSSSINPFLIN